MQGVSKKQQSLVSQNADNKSPNQQITEEKKRNPKQSLILSQQTQKNTKVTPLYLGFIQFQSHCFLSQGIKTRVFVEFRFQFSLLLIRACFWLQQSWRTIILTSRMRWQRSFFFPYLFFINQHFFFALICFIYMFSFNDENIENKASKMTRESAFLSFCCLIKS